MRRPLSALLTLAALVAGCGSEEEPQPATQSRPTTSAPRLAGTYERTLADVDRPLELTLEAGTLTMTDAGSGLRIRQDFSATSDGAFRLGAYQAPDRGSFCGPEVSQTASYSWELAGDVLTLAAEQDECAKRDSILTGDWKRR